MSATLTGKTLVVIDDEQVITETLSSFFGRRNSVLTFLSAESARDYRAGFENVAAFILDYRLPGEDGVSLFKYLREHYPQAKYILISGDLSFAAVEANQHLGFDAMMSKPFDFSILEENIAKLVN